VERGIRLRGVSGPIKGKVWSSDHLLRAGRLSSLEILLDDTSVSRRHAEVRLSDAGWVVTDLDSTNGTYVNGQRLSPGGEHPLHARDIVQFGKIALMVEQISAEAPASDGPVSDQLVLAARIGAADSLPISSDPSVPSVGREMFDRDKMPRVGEQLIALLRAGRHLTHLQSEDQLLDSILHDAVSVLDAQRGAVVLADGDGADPKLKLRSLAVGPREPGTRFPFSKRLVQKAFAAGESMLFTNLSENEEFRMHQSIQDGAMASVLCVLLRTPRRKLGVLHLDRGFFQPAFTNADLRLADALAAHVSAGIECAALLRKQREFFVKTVMAIAQAVELRDSYTYGHTQRVTEYSLLLARKLEVPDDQLALLEFGTPLHDIGKLAIPDAILQKPGRLTAGEFAVMQTHTTRGAEYLRVQEIPELDAVIPIVRSHHERWDGTGYPDRLGREEIPLLARIVAVCDAFDAITSDRPYHEGRKGKPPEVGFSEVERQSGRQFDPRCASAFLGIQDDIRRVLHRHLPGGGSTSDTGPPTINGSASSAEVHLLAGDSYAEFQAIN
jgi:HD-GYP domain-containing protein (c-di-GMP phosphodiesterase class II)